jgi:hypothetical protein
MARVQQTLSSGEDGLVTLALPGPFDAGHGAAGLAVRLGCLIDSELDGRQLSELLWLAAALGLENDVESPELPPTADPSELGPQPGVGENRSGDDLEPSVTSRPATGDEPPDPVDGSHPADDLVATRQVAVGGPGRSASTYSYLAPALRPFKVRWPSGPAVRLDLDETERAYGLTRRLVPALRPAPEPWFSVNLVVDDAITMHPWAERVAGFARLLTHQAAFRSVRVWSLGVRPDGCTVRDRQGRPVRPERLLSPNGRGLVILLSDFVADGWAGQSAWALAQAWAGSTPTALINVLPGRMWRHSWLDFDRGRARSPRPGATNPELLLDVAGMARSSESTLPIMALTRLSIEGWARTLMLGHPIGFEVLRLPDLAELPSSPLISSTQTGEKAALDFLMTATSAAVQVGVLCAALPSISLPVLDLIGSQLVPDSTSADLAEVLVADLFESIEKTDPAVLRFRTDVQGVLVSRLASTDAWRLYDLLTEQAQLHAAYAGGHGTVYDPTAPDDDMPAAARPYAIASAEVLRVLGWDSADPDADLLLASPLTPEPEPEPEPEPSPPAAPVFYLSYAVPR